MGSRDTYKVSLHCARCGTSGVAHWSEWDRPTVYSGTGRRLDGLTLGFSEGPPKVQGGDPTIICEKCRVEVN